MDLEKRLETAQLLNKLIKLETILKFPMKTNQDIATEMDSFVRQQLSNLLLKIMGEKTSESFDDEEVQILKSFAMKIKTQSNIGVKV